MENKPNSQINLNDPEKTISRLEKLKDGDAGLLLAHHKDVTMYYQKENMEFIRNMEMVAGVIFTEEQKARMHQAGIFPVELDKLRSSFRTVKGMLEKNAYDITFNPREKKDQKISQLLKEWYSYVAYAGRFQEADIEAYMNAWAGKGYTETIVEFYEGEEIKINRYNINPLAVYRDPNSRQPINRTDCRFYDRIHMVTKQTLCDKFPWIDFSNLTDNVTTFASRVEKHIDNSHEHMDTQNDTYKVIERLYKVTKNQYWHIDEDMNKQEVDEETGKKMMKEGKRINYKAKQYLYVALMCPAWNSANFIYNGEYFCQPRRQCSDEIIFPIQEIASEAINGKLLNYVTPLVTPALLLSSAATQLYDLLKQESGNNMISNKLKFESPEEAERYSRERILSGKTFWAANGVQLSDVAVPAAKTQGASTTSQSLIQLAANAFMEQSSVPPALQGVQESASVSGVLNESRQQAATTQHQGFFSNILKYQRNCAELDLAYLFAFKDNFIDTTFRIVENPNRKEDPKNPLPDQMTMMEPGEMVQTVDEEGNLTEEIELLNDPTVYQYDIVVSPSYYTPSEREKSLSKMIDMMKMGLLNANPQMANELILGILDLLDIPPDVKDKIIAGAQQAQQAEIQAGQIEAQGGMIDNAQNLGNPNLGGQPPEEGAAPVPV